MTVAVRDHEARRVPGYDLATARTVSVVMSDGRQILGSVRVYRPEGRDRLSDWARHGERFRYIETADTTFIVNIAHVVEVQRGVRTMSTSCRSTRYFHAMSAAGASDLHLCVGSPPIIRKDGQMQPLDASAHPRWRVDDVEALLAPIMPERNRQEFAQRHDTDFAYEIRRAGALSRQRVLRSRRAPARCSASSRPRFSPPSSSGLSQPPPAAVPPAQGTVLVTGPTGSGKSTTLCAMIDYINRTRQDHIITIEDPIEFVHQNQKCLINQREVRTHTDSFKDALRAALREDPDIVLVGELRDLETVAIAIETAETGPPGLRHASHHDGRVDRRSRRSISFRRIGRRRSASCCPNRCAASIAQNLCRKIGGGRVAALEVLIVTQGDQQPHSRGQNVPDPVDDAGRQGRRHGLAERRADGPGHEEARRAGRGLREGRRQGRLRGDCSSGPGSIIARKRRRSPPCERVPIIESRSRWMCARSRATRDRSRSRWGPGRWDWCHW